ncbi:MAG: hypothetical protein PHD37_02255 [Gallionellaceae bacterium]|nr:hypothetical protein [Gallionellaceae bacterium]
MRGLFAVFLALAAVAAVAAPIDVAPMGIYHHLDASGRRNLALAGGQVALVWEDSRSGSPRCYLGLKAGGETTFREYSLGHGECFDPVVAALDGQRFLLAWEDESGINSSIADAAGPGASINLGAGSHASVAAHPVVGAHVAWNAPAGRWQRVWRAQLRVEGARLRAGKAQAADGAPPSDDQSFPALAASEHGVLLAWEDRRHGHTVIYASRSADGQIWNAPLRVSGNPTGKAQNDLGRGTGAMRPAVAGFGARFAAAWLDKRDFLSGYDVYAALSEGAGFAKDVKAQDSFGDAIAQWHVAAAGNRRGDLLIAWDDERDGTSDIWLTRLTPGGYSEDFTFPDLSGPARQSDPAIALDEAGNLHLAWIERAAGGESNGPTRLRYTVLPLPMQ